MRNLLMTLVLAALPAIAHADTTDIQTRGAEDFPGKFEVRLSPFGGQFGFTNRSVSGYKLALDFAGRVKKKDKLSIWIGGGIGYAPGSFHCYNAQVGDQFLVGDCGNDVQFSLFAMVTFERFVRFPIVPFVKAGLSGEVMPRTNRTGGAVADRIGAGVDYWIIRNVGAGVETNFTFGPGFLNGHTFFYGSFDLLVGVRFAF